MSVDKTDTTSAAPRTRAEIVQGFIAEVEDGIWQETEEGGQSSGESGEKGSEPDAGGPDREASDGEGRGQQAESGGAEPAAGGGGRLGGQPSEGRAEEQPQDGRTGFTDGELAALARHESALRAQEKRLKEREATLETELRDKALADLKRQLSQDPLGTLEALGVQDTGHLAQMIWARKLGKDADPALREKLAQYESNARIAALERKLEEQAKAPPDNSVELALAQRDLSAVMTSPPESAPHFQRLVESDKAVAEKTIVDLYNFYLNQGAPRSIGTIVNEFNAAYEKEREFIMAGSNGTPAAEKQEAKATEEKAGKSLSGKTEAPNRKPLPAGASFEERRRRAERILLGRG